jgi:hypothetical protein
MLKPPLIADRFLTALSVTGAVFPILLDQPFVRLVKISSRPMVDGLSHLTK